MFDGLKVYSDLVKSDLFRYTGRISKSDFIKNYLGNPGFKYMFWFRTVDHFRTRNKVIMLYAKYRLKHFSYKFGIHIPPGTRIDKGFYIGHFSGIVVSQFAVIGKNVNISQGVTIGKANRGKNAGAAIISDEVYIGPGAKIVGKVHIGKNVAIGANAVVTKDVPENAVVAGVPAKIISLNGAEGYINRKV